MSRVSRLLVAPAVVAVIAAALVLAADTADAQPPRDFGKLKEFQKEKGFPKDKEFPKDKDFRKEFPRDKGFPKDRVRDVERKGEPDDRADALRRLEAELDRVRAHEAELQERMRELRGGIERREFDRGGPERVVPRGPQAGMGPRGPMAPMGPFGPRGPMGGGGPPFARGMGPGFNPEMLERMEPQQIKEIIGMLQRVLEEKTRGERGRDKPPTGEPRDDVLRRLDQLTKEIEELRRAIGK